MAYKRTTKSRKSGNVTLRTTTTSHSNGKMPTVSWTVKRGNTTRTVNPKTGAVWQTTNNNGWITKQKVNGFKPKPAPKPRKARRKKTTNTSNPSMAGVWVIGIIGLIIYFWLSK